MQSIKVGTLSGGHEVIINNGSVQQVDTQGIKATWKGVDSQSGILGYQVAIGNTSGRKISIDGSRLDPHPNPLVKKRKKKIAI